MNFHEREALEAAILRYLTALGREAPRCRSVPDLTKIFPDHNQVDIADALRGLQRRRLIKADRYLLRTTGYYRPTKRGFRTVTAHNMATA